MNKNPKETARSLREQGLSLDQIYKLMKAPRSTVYYWIRKEPLNEEQRKQLDIKRAKARMLGHIACRNKRLASIEKCNQQGLKDVGKISTRDLFISGVALYWAEGAKQRKKDVSASVEFCNQDPRMILLFCKWLDILEIPPNMRQYTLYIHKHYNKLDHRIKQVWQSKLKGYISKWEKTVFKKHDSDRRITKDYIGLLRIRVRKSSNLSRRIAGWINAINSLT